MSIATTRYYLEGYNPKTKPVSPTEVLVYNQCQKLHKLVYGDKKFGLLEHTEDNFDSHLRAWLHHGFQTIQAMRINTLNATKIFFREQLVEPIHDFYFLDTEEKEQFRRLINPQVYTRLSSKAKISSLNELITAETEHNKIKNNIINSTIGAEVRFIDNEIESIFDLVHRKLQDKKQYYVLGEVKCFTNNSELKQDVDKAHLQMRVGYQAFKKQFKKTMDNGLLTMIDARKYPEKIVIYDKWFNLSENETEVLDLMKKTRQNRFSNQEKTKCANCELENLCGEM